MELVIGGASLAVIIIILVEVIKRLGLAIKLVPALAILLGIIGGVVAALTSEITMVEGVIGGILSGAAASGLYDNLNVPFRQPTMNDNPDHE